MRPSAGPRIGARVMLLDPDDRVLLIHALDPDEPDHHWWELPGGGLEPGETPEQAARREVLEETGIDAIQLVRPLWTSELHRGEERHRVDHVFLGRTTTTEPQKPLRLTETERVGVIERRWWSAAQLESCPDEVVPADLAEQLRKAQEGPGTPQTPPER
ncbi:NUDIX domain-containing protein [Actinokineospora sp. NBRC 105648]|uniref:NUDIX hydrolase n=1 Tax=Actinokineospora sp. NBRC 105648 TaxID=3032206 RepID=UPI0024A46C6D|nr:NUDIX domain-containing protein [Actinokineospora sp. NBRC 105648]GLZ43304.1 DNA mismatch repair protein MutT [Actinokineospora sp. NBRC 105648]